MNPTPTQQRRKVKIRPLNMTTQKGVLVFMFGWLDGSDGCRGPEFREFFSEIWATVRCSENSVIFGRHAERSVTDKMSSFHSERLTPDTHIRLPWEGPVCTRSLGFASFFLSRLIERFLAADGQNALGTKVSQKPKYSSSFLPCQSLLLTLRALRVTQIIGRSTLQALEDLPSARNDAAAPAAA
jgi:hypothetical protein